MNVQQGSFNREVGGVAVALPRHFNFILRGEAAAKKIPVENSLLDIENF